MEAEALPADESRHAFNGTVQGIGWAVIPKTSRSHPGLPGSGASSNWVQIAQRFPGANPDRRPSAAPSCSASALSAVAIILL